MGPVAEQQGGDFGAAEHDHEERTVRTAALVDQLHAIVRELEEMHPGRRFPLDGHLVGSIGEAAAEALFEVELVPPSSLGHDATASDGRKVEIKATYGTRSVAIRKTSHKAATALIVLRLSRPPCREHEVVFNGPISTALQVAGPLQANGQSQISLARLRQLNESVSGLDRVPVARGPSVAARRRHAAGSPRRLHTNARVRRDLLPHLSPGGMIGMCLTRMRPSRRHSLRVSPRGKRF